MMTAMPREQMPGSMGRPESLVWRYAGTSGTTSRWGVGLCVNWHSQLDCARGRRVFPAAPEAARRDSSAVQAHGCVLDRLDWFDGLVRDQSGASCDVLLFRRRAWGDDDRHVGRLLRAYAHAVRCRPARFWDGVGNWRWTNRR